jgi:hypothetical protein
VIEAMLAGDGGVRAAFDGVVFRVPRERAPESELAAIARLGARLGTRDEAMVRLAGDNPAIALAQELDAANRVAATLFAAHSTPSVGVWLDTFADVDRGYFPRAGLVDRRYNPRMAGRVCRNLNSALAGLAADASGWELVLPPAGYPGVARRWIDLSSGVVGAGPVACPGPVLVEREAPPAETE